MTEFINPYRYANGVMENKFDVTDKESLRELEYTIAVTGMSDILRGRRLEHLLEFGLPHLMAN